MARSNGFEKFSLITPPPSGLFSLTTNVFRKTFVSCGPNQEYFATDLSAKSLLTGYTDGTRANSCPDPLIVHSRHVECQRCDGLDLNVRTEERQAFQIDVFFLFFRRCSSGNFRKRDRDEFDQPFGMTHFIGVLGSEPRFGFQPIGVKLVDCFAPLTRSK